MITGGYNKNKLLFVAYILALIIFITNYFTIISLMFVDNALINFFSIKINTGSPHNLIIFNTLLLIILHFTHINEKVSIENKKFLAKFISLIFSTAGVFLALLLVMILLTGGKIINLSSSELPSDSLINVLFVIILTIFAAKEFANKKYIFFISKARFFLSNTLKTENVNYALIFGIIFLISWWWTFSENIIVEGDGIGYYSYLRSAIMDRDLDFTNEFIILKSWEYGLPYPWEKISTEYVSNPYSIGPAIMWAPFFILAILATKLLNLLGFHFSADGFSPVFIIFVAASSKIYAYLGLLFMYKSLKLFFDKSISFISTIFIWLATPLAYYTHFELFMSHTHSFFSISIATYYTLKELNNDFMKKWFTLGVLMGLVALCRWQDSLFILMPIFLFFCKFKAVSKCILNYKSILINMLIYLFTFLSVASLQLIVFKIIYGYWFGIPQGKEFMLLYPAFIGEVLFSPLHGLIHWHPIILFSLIGLIHKTVKKDKTYLIFLIIFIINLLFNSAIAQWWGGHSFGMRRLINCSAIFAFGLAAFLTSLNKRKITKFIILSLCIILSIINLFAIVAYILQIIPHEANVNFYEITKTVIIILNLYSAKQLILFLLVIFYIIILFKKGGQEHQTH